MKIKQYTSQQRISAPQVQPTQVADPIDLSQAIGFLEATYDQGVREKAEEQKLFLANEVTRTQLAIDEEYMKASEAVKNGDYSAKKRYEEFYNKTVSTSLGRLSEFDPQIVEGARLDFERSGVKNGLRLKSAVNSKMKSDANQSARNRLKILKKSYFDAQTPEEQAAVLSDVNSSVSVLEANGAISPGMGKDVVSAWVGDIEKQSIMLQMQTDVTGALERIESQKDNLSIPDYISLRGQALSREQEINDALYVEDYLKSGQGEVPSQSQVDQYSNSREALEEAGAINIFDREAEQASLLANTKKLSSAMKQRFDSMFYMNAEEVTPDTAAQIASTARVIKEGVSENPGLIGAKGITKDQKLISDIIVEQIGRGVNETDAVKRALERVNDPNYATVYDNFRKNLLKSDSGETYKKFADDISAELGFETEMFGMVRAEAIDIYTTSRAYGASHKDAVNSTKEALSSDYGKFNGQVVMTPPHRVTKFSDESQWIEMARQGLAEVMPGLSDKMQPALMGSEATRVALANGAPDDQIPFLLGYYTEGGGFVGIPDEDGSLKVVYADARMNTMANSLENIMEGESDALQANLAAYIEKKGYSQNYVAKNYNLIKQRYLKGGL